MNREYVKNIKLFLRNKHIIWNERLYDEVDNVIRKAEDSDFSYNSQQKLIIESREEMEMVIITKIDLLRFEIVGADYNHVDGINNEQIINSYTGDYTEQWVEYQRTNSKRLFTELINKHCVEQREKILQKYVKDTKNNKVKIKILNIRLENEINALEKLRKKKTIEQEQIALVERNIKRLKKKISRINSSLYIAEVNHDNSLLDIERIENLI